MRLRATVRAVVMAGVTALLAGGTLVAAGAVSAPGAGAVSSGSADLGLTMSASPPSTVSPGGDITYTITITNHGPDAAPPGVAFSDTPPAGTTVFEQSDSSSPPIGVDCQAPTPTSPVTCTSNATWPSGDSVTFTVGVQVATNATPGSTLTDAATVTSSLADPNPANNADTATTNVVGAPQLGVAKSHVGTFTQGQPGTYAIDVSNTGTGATSGTVTAADTLPTGLTATAMSGTGWSCVVATVTCTRSDSLAPASTYPVITLNVTVADNAPASVTNTATASGGGSATAASANDPTTIVPAAKKATALEAEPVLFRLFPFHMFFPSLQATLTTAQGGTPVPGETVRFFAAQTFVCQGVTNAGGLASCNANGHLVQLLVSAGDRAVFAGDPQFGPSQARGPLIGF